MQDEQMIDLESFCTSHEVELSFIRSLEGHGLIELIIVNQAFCIPGGQLQKLEQALRLYRELNINPEGIDAIHHLLFRIDEMQQEITSLRNKLQFFEDET